VRSEKCVGRTNVRFLILLQEEQAIAKTRNRLLVKHDPARGLYGTKHGLAQASIVPRDGTPVARL
jgi:hypothetical protein